MGQLTVDVRNRFVCLRVFFCPEILFTQIFITPVRCHINLQKTDKVELKGNFYLSYEMANNKYFYGY